MKRRYTFIWGVVIALIAPMLACGPAATFEVTPTPTKTPRRIKLLPEATAPTPTPAMIQPNTPLPEVVDTPTPVPTDTPVAEVPTDTPVSEAAPTDTPPPPPPPTNTPVPPPPPPTNTPAPPPPTPVPVNQGPKVDVQLEDGSNYHVGEKVKIKIVVWDPDGVDSFTWGIFTQNQVGLKGGDKKCNGATECSTHIEESIPIPGTFIIGADAVDTKGNTNRGLGEIYVK
jgi:hypothetical protein